MTANLYRKWVEVYLDYRNNNVLTVLPYDISLTIPGILEGGLGI